MTFFSLVFICLVCAGFSRNSEEERYHRFFSGDDGDSYSISSKQSSSSTLSSPTFESAEALAAVLFSLSPSVPSWYSPRRSRADHFAVVMGPSASPPQEDDVVGTTPESTLDSTEEPKHDELRNLVIGVLDRESREDAQSESNNAVREDAVMDNDSAVDAAEDNLRELVIGVLDDQGVEVVTNDSYEQGGTNDERRSIEVVVPDTIIRRRWVLPREKAMLETESEKLMEDLETIIKEATFVKPETETLQEVEGSTNPDDNFENVLTSLQADIPQILWKAPHWDFFDEDFKLIDQTGLTVDGVAANKRLLQFLQSLRRTFAVKESVEVDFTDTDSFTREIFPRRAFRATWKIQPRIGKSTLNIEAEASWHFSEENKLDYVRFLRFSANGVDVKLWPEVELYLTELDNFEKKRDVLIEDAMKANLQLNILKDSLANASADRAKISREKTEEVRVASSGLEVISKQLADLRPVNESAPVQDLRLDAILDLLEATAAEFSTEINALVNSEKEAEQEFKVLSDKLEMDIVAKTVERNEMVKQVQHSHIAWKQAGAALIDARKANQAKIEEWANQIRQEEVLAARNNRDSTVTPQVASKTSARDRRLKGEAERPAKLKANSDRKKKAEASRQARLKEAAERRAKKEAAEKAKAEVEQKTRLEAAAIRKAKTEARRTTRLKAESEGEAKGESQSKKRLQANVDRESEVVAKMFSFLKRRTRPTVESTQDTRAEPQGQTSKEETKAKGEAQRKNRLQQQRAKQDAIAQERRLTGEAERMAKLKADSERKKKAEASRQARLKEAAERKAKKEAAEKAKVEVEQKARLEAAAIRKANAEARRSTRLKAAVERVAKGEAQRKKRLQQQRAQQETIANERRLKEEAERMAKLKADSDRKKKAEASRQARLKEAAERKARKEAAEKAKAEIEQKRRLEAEAIRKANTEARRTTRLKKESEKKTKVEAQRKNKAQVNVDREAEVLTKIPKFLNSSTSPKVESTQDTQPEPQGQRRDEDQMERNPDAEREEDETLSQEGKAMNIETVLNTLKEDIQSFFHKEPAWNVLAENFRVLDEDGQTIASLRDSRLLARLLRWMSEDFVVNDKVEVDFNDTKAFTRRVFPRRSFGAYWDVQLRGEQRDKSKGTRLRRFSFWSPRQQLVDIDMDTIFHFNDANKVDYVRITGVNADGKKLSNWPNMTLSDALDENATKTITEWVKMLRA